MTNLNMISSKKDIIRRWNQTNSEWLTILHRENISLDVLEQITNELDIGVKKIFHHSYNPESTFEINIYNQANVLQLNAFIKGDTNSRLNISYNNNFLLRKAIKIGDKNLISLIIGHPNFEYVCGVNEIPVQFNTIEHIFDLLTPRDRVLFVTDIFSRMKSECVIIKPDELCQLISKYNNYV